MGDALQSFRSSGDGDGGEEQQGHELELLVFAHGNATYGVPAASVDAVVAWRKPARLPASVSGVAGVVQDRGRIVVVLDTPLGRAGTLEDSERRVVICTTNRGLLGLPCKHTDQVGTITFAHEPTTGELVDSTCGPLIFLEPNAIAESLGR